MKKTSIGALLCFAALAVHAANWHNITESVSNGSSYDIDAQSTRYGKNNADEVALFVVGRITTKTKNIEVFTWYVTMTDCARKRGKFISLDMDGKFLDSTDYAFGVGNIVSILAETMCELHTAIQEKRNRQQRYEPRV